MKTHQVGSRSLATWSVRALVCSAMLVSFTDSAHGAFTNFITRSGSSIMDGSSSFRFIGANMPEVTHIRTDFDLLEGQRMRFPSSAEIDYLVGVAAQANIKVIRTWCFPSLNDGTNVSASISYFFPDPNGTTVTLNQEAFEVFDYLLKVCEAKGVRLQIPFVYQWVMYGSDGKVHPQMKDFVSKVLNRTNTLTGVQYKNDKTIYCWESGNEIDPTDAWITDLASYVKGIDSNHLFMDGRDYAQDIYDEYYSDTVLAANVNIDLASYHCYAGTGHDTANGWSVSTTLANINTRLNTYNKALDIGEISLLYSVSTLTSVLSAIQSNGVHSGSYWSWKGIKSQGGYMQWNGNSWGPNDDLRWPGFVSTLSGVSTEKGKVDALVGYHYSIQGGSRPSLPLPLAAHLLPVRDAGHISWQPGVGEQTADIERSTDGINFSVVLTGYETFRSSHAALFADTGVSVSSSYYYRVRSKNTSGSAASYSNVVGPVSVANRWLVDDLWDKTKMNSSSTGAVVNASYDSVPYHNDLAYLTSSGGSQNIVYNVGVDINQVTVLSNNDTATVSVDASVNGSSYAAITSKRTMYPALHGEFAGHPRIVYLSGDLTSGGYRYIRVNFGASDVLSRVEIAYGGTAVPPVTEYVVDNSDSGFSTVGSWTTSTANSGTYGVPHFLNANYLHDGDALSGGSKSATWTSPITSTGVYDVYLRWSGNKLDTSRPDAAPIEINYNGGVVNLTANQQRKPGQWNLLGTWSFTGGSGDYLKISDTDTGYTIADSVRWVKILDYDNFADQNDTGWTKTGGTWSVVNDSGYCYDQSNSSGEALAVFGSSGWKDYIYDADVKVTGEGAGATGPGLAFRVVDSNNYYLLQLRRPANVVRLWKKQAGAWTQIGSDVPFTSSTGVWYAMRVELAGTSIRGYVNDCKMIDLLDSTFTAGAVGFRTGNTAARLDNVHIK